MFINKFCQLSSDLAILVETLFDQCTFLAKTWWQQKSAYMYLQSWIGEVTYQVDRGLAFFKLHCNKKRPVLVIDLTQHSPLWQLQASDSILPWYPNHHSDCWMLFFSTWFLSYSSTFNLNPLPGHRSLSLSSQLWQWCTRRVQTCVLKSFELRNSLRSH